MKMRYANVARKYIGERESVDRRLDRLMDTIREELEKGSPEDYRRLLARRRRMQEKKQEA